MHMTVRWLRNGKVRTRCRDSVRHRDATTFDQYVDCVSCLRRMARDDVNAGGPARYFAKPDIGMHPVEEANKGKAPARHPSEDRSLDAWRKVIVRDPSEYELKTWGITNCPGCGQTFERIPLDNDCPGCGHGRAFLFRMMQEAS